MTATERIRAMLDERGVKWTEPSNDERSRTTYWTAGLLNCTAVEFDDGVVNVSLTAYCVTPEQAIEATLGRGECKKLPSDGITRCFVRRYGYEIEFGYWKCSACGCECFEGARYCMGCGRKVRE